MKHTTNLVPITRAALHVQRWSAAQTRHNTSPAEIYTATAGGIIIAPASWDSLTEYADRAVQTTLKARYRSSGQRLFLDLLNARQRDKYARHAAELESRAAEAQTAGEEAEAAAEAAEAEKNMMIDSATTTEAAAAERAADAEANAAKSNAKDISAAALSKLSDRADLIQAAALAVLEEINNPASTADARELYHIAAHGAQQAIAQLAHPQAVTQSHSKATPCTEAEFLRLLELYGEASTRRTKTHLVTATNPQPAAITRTGKYSYITGERRTDSRTGKVQYVRVYHYYTPSPYISWDELTEDGEQTSADNRSSSRAATGVNAVQGQGDSDAINALFTRANLSPRERQLCWKAADQIAQAAGDAAYNAYMAKVKERERRAPSAQAAAEIRCKSKKPAAQARRAAMLDSAASRAGLTKAAAAVLWSRIRAKLDAARYDTPEDEPSKATRTAYRKPRKAKHQRPAPVWYLDSTSPAPAPVVAWVPAPDIPADAWRAEPIEDAPRILTEAESRARAALEVRQRYESAADIVGAQPANIYAAVFALVPVLARTEGVDELTIWGEIAADEARTARRAALEQVKSKYPALEQWRAMSRAERDKWAKEH